MITSSARILITDDDPLALSAATRLLKSAGYEVFSAINGEQTLQLVEEHHPDMMLLDVVLPDIEGTEICRRLKADARTADIFIIILSGSRIRSDEQSEGMEGGADGYIARPIANRELLARIQAYMRIKTAELRAKEYYQYLEEMIAERKRAEEALQDSLTNLGEAQRIAHVGSWEWDMISNTVRWSKEMYRVYDISPDTYDGKAESLLKVIHPDDVELFVKSMEDNLASGNSPSLEYRVIHKDGSIHNIFTVGSVKFDAAGKPIRSIGTAQDITERKQVEGQLRKLSRAVEQSPASIVITDLLGNIEYVNPKFSQVTGYSFEEAIGQNPRILKSGHTPQEEYKKMWSAIRSGKVWQGEFLNKKKNGEDYWEFATIAPVFSDDRKVTNFLALKENITERKQAEEALRESEVRYRTVAESAHDAIISADHAGMVVAWNQSAERIFGYTATEVIGQSLSLLVPQPASEQHLAGIQRLQAGGKPHIIGKSVEVIGRRKDGSEFPLELSLSAWEIAEGNFYTGIIRDITERKRAEDELRSAKDGLETINLELQQSLAREEILARNDGLTRLCNRRHFFDLATREFHAAVRYQCPLAFIMFDMDNFKQINDTLGHAVGDKVLTTVAQTAAVQARASDVLARYGGDEFIIMLPHTSAQHAFPIAERIRAGVAAILVDAFRDDKEPLAVTLSMGIAETCLEPVDENVECVIQRADKGLYAAKQNGRNRIVIFGMDETETAR